LVFVLLFELVAQLSMKPVNRHRPTGNISTGVDCAPAAWILSCTEELSTPSFA